MLNQRKISESKNKVTFFRNLKWRSTSNPSNTQTETFWLVRTNFRREKFIQYLKMKHLFVGLPEDELQLLLDCPGVLEDPLFVSALRAIQFGISSAFLEAGFNELFKMGQTRTPMSTNLFYTWDNTLTYQIYVAEQAIRKAKKFSGYVRNSSAVGSKRKRPTSTEPEHFLWNEASEIDYFTFLTVGEFSPGSPGGAIITLKSSLRTKRKTF